MNKPQRIQRKRAKGFNLQQESMALNGLPAVSVTRPGKWGNPYTVSTDGSVHKALEHYEAMAKGARGEIQRALRGKNLACWCKKSERCHADILLRIANN